MTRAAMGTEFQALVGGDDARELERAANHALDEVERIDGQMSLYKPDSELCWVNAHAGERAVPVEPGLFDVLARARSVWQDTDGAFDVTVGPLLDCWGFFRGRGTVPPAEKIAEALERVGMAHVQLDPRERTVRFDRPGVKIDLGGIAKGFAVDRAAELLRESGVTQALVHGGRSTVYGLGSPPDAEGWPVGVRHPYDPERRLCAVSLRGRALSTSGTYEKFFEHEGVVYSHIIDPRTGRPVQGVLSATAVTESAMDSDALSTAFFVIGEAKTREYCETRTGVGALFVPCPAEGREPAPVSIGSVQ